MGTGDIGGKNMVLKQVTIVFVALLIAPAIANAFICGLYFTSSRSCDDCRIIEDYIFNQSNLTQNIMLLKYDMTENGNIAIANKFLFQYGLSEQYEMPKDVPFIMFDERNHLTGKDEIKECLHLKIDQFAEDGGSPCPLLKEGPKGSDSGGGDETTGNADNSKIPGNPEIVKINTKRPFLYEREVGDNNITEGKKKRINESEKLIKKKMEEEKNMQEKAIIGRNFPFIYLAMLAFVVVLSVLVYRKRSR